VPCHVEQPLFRKADFPLPRHVQEQLHQGNVAGAAGQRVVADGERQVDFTQGECQRGTALEGNVWERESIVLLESTFVSSMDMRMLLPSCNCATNPRTSMVMLMLMLMLTVGQVRRDPRAQITTWSLLKIDQIRQFECHKI
jgi:hypothetical protein